MQKLKYAVLDKILDNCTNREIDFILYISQYQNELGQVRGLDYKFVCLHLGIAKQTFYDILYGLESKSIISINWTNDKSNVWDITILDNSFIEYKNYRDGYLNTNKYFLYQQEFRMLKPGIKKLILRLLKVNRADQSFKISFEKLLKWTGLKNKAVLDDYIQVLKQYFNITVSKNTLIIKLKNIIQSYKDTDLYKYITHSVTTFCRKYKIAYTLRDLTDLFFIFDNRKNTYSKIINALCDTALRYRSLEPALINSIVSR